MSDVSTLPDQPAVAPRHSAALIVAATLSFVGAALTIGALFPDYWDRPPLALVDQTGPLATTVVFAVGLLLAGALLLGPRSSPIGAAMLLVIVAIGLQPRVFDAVRLGDSTGPRAGTGYALVTAGFVLALVAAVLSALVLLRPREWALRGGARFLAVLATLTGFAAAVGYGMSPFSVDAGRFSIAFESPLQTLPRQLWAALLVVVVLTVVPAIAIAVGGRIGTGLALGLLFGIGGIVALRVGTIYGTVDGIDVGYTAAEGTWTLLAAGGAALIMTFAGLAAGGARAPRTPARAPVQATVPPAPPGADEPTQPIVVGDTPEAIEYTPDADDEVTGPIGPIGPIGTGDSAPTRAEPMPSATRDEATIPGDPPDQRDQSDPDAGGPRD